MDPIEIVFSVITAIFSLASIANTVIAYIHNVRIEEETAERERKNLTIEQYHRIAYGDGPLRTFYQMTDDKYKEYLDIASSKRDDLREDEDETFLKLEDMLGMLDEFASGINEELYDYETFRALAYNYCKKRVFNKLSEILHCYNNDKNNNDLSYQNLDTLLKRIYPQYKALYKVEKCADS